MSLDDAFAPQTPLLGMSAVEVFTDRVDQATAFDASLDSVMIGVGLDSCVTDLSRPRANVLAFHGMGGIGKSTLSRELERRYRSLLESRGFLSAPTYRVDFASGAERDIESILLGLRGAIATKRGKLHAFDLAFQHYWSLQHPGRPLQEAFDTDPRLRRLNRRFDLADDIQASIEDLLGVATFGVFGFGRAIGGETIRYLRQKALQRELLRECPNFSQIMLSDDPESMLPYLPYLLGWGFHQSQSRSRDGELVVPVIFFDTWEDVQSRSAKQGDLEDILSRLIYLMPNCLFVITGRERLDWAMPHRRSSLKYYGSCWRNLGPITYEDPTQHLLGYLSPKDSDDFLRACLVDSSGEPVIPTDERERIIRASDGLPYYLDLAADMYATALVKGDGPPQLSGNLPELVASMLRGLDTVERDLLCAAATLGVFNKALLEFLVPQASPLAVDRFVARHLVQHNPERWLPFQIHDRVAEEVRAYGGAETWDSTRWMSTYARCIEWLCDPDSHDRVYGVLGARSVAQAVILASRLMTTCNVSPAAYVEILTSAEALGLRTALQECAGILTDARRPECRVMGSMLAPLLDAKDMALLVDVLNASRSEIVTIELARWFDRALIHAANVLGRLDISAPAADRLESSCSAGLAGVALVAVGGVKFRQGKFRDIIPQLRTARDDSPAVDIARLDLLGLIRLHEGDFSLADECFGEGLNVATNLGLVQWTARCSRHLALARSLTRPGPCRQALDQATEINTAIGDTIGIAQCNAARSILLLMQGKPEEAEQERRTAVETLRLYDAHHDALTVHTLWSSALWRVGRRSTAGGYASTEALKDAYSEVMPSWRFLLAHVAGVDAFGPPYPVEWSRDVSEVLQSWYPVPL